MIRQFVKDVEEEKIDPVFYTEDVLKEAHAENEKNNYYNAIDEEFTLGCAKEAESNKKNKGKLSGVPLTIKDCICVKDVESRGGSAILNGHKPRYHATVVQKLLDAGAVIVGKASQDEFGFGSFNTNVGVGFSIPKNPHDPERVCGGSSGGSCAIVASSKHQHVGIAESTGGSIVCPAAFCGVVGLCPTYGRVSRYGLMDYANSLDKIGPVGKTVVDCARVLEVISGSDDKESTSSDEPVDDYVSYAEKDISGMKVGVVKNAFGEGVDPKIVALVEKKIESLRKAGCEIVEIDLPLTFTYGIETYYIIAMSETSTNQAKFCGLRYGSQTDPLGKSFNDYFSEVRSQFLGEEAKRRILIGTFARMAGQRDAMYLQAMKVRTMIIEEYKKAFSTCDVLLTPTMPFIAPQFSEVDTMTPLQEYMADIMTVGPNLAGLPHMNIPCGKVEEMPAGLMVVGDHFKEGKLIQIGSFLEKN